MAVLPDGRRLGRWLGWLVLAAALVFVAGRLWRHEVWALAGERLAPLLAAALAGALIYGLASFLLSAAWRQLLAGERQPASASGYHAVYGRTQIAKYLPGNCFHFVGRQVLGRMLGHSQRALALASLLEAALLVALAAALAAPLARGWLGDWALLLAPTAAASLALCCSAPRLLPAGWAPPPAAGVLRAIAAYGLFFAIAGGLVWLLAVALADHAPSLPLTAVSALALAWVAGFAVPGSSAGLGVREAVLMLALDDPLGAQAAAAVALALRLVTTLGDGVFCALALLLPLPTSASKPSSNHAIN